MSKSDAFEQSLLLLIFNAVPIADIADNDQTSPAGSLTVSLHTGDPGEVGTMATSEAIYTGYTRVTVVRSAAGWTVSGGVASPVANIDFPQATGGNDTITHFGIGTGVANNLMYSGTVTPNIVVTNGVQPRLTTASTITET